MGSGASVLSQGRGGSAHVLVQRGKMLGVGVYVNGKWVVMSLVHLKGHGHVSR